MRKTAALADVLNSLKELVEITRRMEEHTKDIKELKEGQKATLNKVKSLEKTLDARLAAIEDKPAVKEDIFTIEKELEKTKT